MGPTSPTTLVVQRKGAGLRSREVVVRIHPRVPSQGEKVSGRAHNPDRVGSIPAPATNFAGIAQVEECLSYKQECAGSIPAPRTSADVAQRKRQPAQTRHSVGSNPSVRTNLENAVAVVVMAGC